MGERTFSKKEAIVFGWNAMKANIGFFIGLLVLVMFVYILLGALTEATRENAPLVSILVQIVQGVVQIIIGMGLLRIALRVVKNEKATFRDLVECWPLFIKFAVSSFIYGLITLAGTLLLIVPGIIWGIQFQYFRYFIVEKGQGPIEALKSSSQITKGSKWNLFLFSLLLGLINLAGILALMVGLFATIPLAIVADAYVYRKLAVQIEGQKTV